jgi:hypothetical protein
MSDGSATMDRHPQRLGRSAASLHRPMTSSALRSYLRNVVVVAVLGLVGAGCGSSAKAPHGLSNSGPGLQVSQPSSQPNQPAWGEEKFHIHALLHIYVNGLLSPLAADIGLDPANGIESSMHTHDGTGIIHMEAPHPFNYTLGDFFSVWGVKLGPAQVGGLKGDGGDRLHFYLNGKPLSNPAALVLHKDDSVVIGYGPPSGYPHNPSKFLLTEVDKGEGGLGCGATKKGHKSKSCFAPKESGNKPKASAG